MRIVEKSSFVRRKNYEAVVTDGFGVPRCGQDELYAGLCCTAKRRPALPFLRPFDWTNVLFVEASGRRLRVMSERCVLIGVLSKDAYERWDVVTDDVSDVGAGAVEARNLFTGRIRR